MQWTGFKIARRCQARYECRMKRLFYKVKDWYRGEYIPKLPAKYGITNKAHRRKEPNKSDFIIRDSTFGFQDTNSVADRGLHQESPAGLAGSEKGLRFHSKCF